MAAEQQYPPEENQEEEDGEAEKAAKEEEEEEIAEEVKKVMCSYLGVSFGVFLALAPRNWRELQRQVRELTSRLWQAEEQVKQMRSRRKEDSKANARVVEIFASHRNKWQAEEKRFLNQIDEANQEVAHLNARIADFEKAEADSRVRILHLERELAERDEMIGFMSRTAGGGGDGGGGSEFEEHSGGGGCRTEWYASGAGVKEDYGGGLETERELEDLSVLYEQHQQLQSQHSNGFDSELFSSASKLWAERASVWQDVQYESLESMYNIKHFVARRESPWKVDGESTGVSSKLKVLEEELLNLEKVGKTDLSKVPSLMRKQAKRYQALAGKIDDLCRRMQASDPCEPTLTTEFRTQRQTEFLLEAFRLQQRASETGQKLIALQTEVGKSYHGDELVSQAKLTTKRSLDSIRNNFKEIQRNLEIWLARIIGDLEGILARDGASRVREYYISRNPFVQ